MKNIIIAIDGHSSCGKSTVAKGIAEKLDLVYIDSGAMYRAVTLYCLQNKLIVDDQIIINELEKQLNKIEIDFVKEKITGKYQTFLNKVNVESEIRKIDVSSFVSPVSKIKKVREKLVEIQRSFANNNSVIMDGRDIGTVVFPDADLKIFMTANINIRAKRRYDELIAKGQKVELVEIEKNIVERDRIDQSRKISPLKKADDALILDNSFLNHEEQLNWVLEKMNELINK